MFTGLVETMGEVVALEPDGPGRRLVLREPDVARDLAIGDSIANNGCCLTVIAIDGDTFAFEAGSETLSRTNLGELVAGDHVNLERSLRTGDRLGGHFVTGHIDCVGTLDERVDDADWSTLWFRFPKQYARFMASKGSIAVDGVSLTLVDVEVDRFSVALIPHTLSVTTLGALSPGDRVNLETDLLAKYVGEQIKAFDN
jgi:riboflavin synthase